MAVVTLKSGQVTNRDSIPAVLSDGANVGGKMYEAVGSVVAGAGDSVGSKYVLCSIPSNARISQLLLYAADLGTTAAADFGLYKSTADGGAVVDADFFKAAVDMFSAALNGLEITHGNVMSIDKMEKKVWELLGLASDPSLMYDVVATVTGVVDGGGNLGVKLRYAK